MTITSASLAPHDSLRDPALRDAIMGLLDARRRFSGRDPTLGVLALSADLGMLCFDRFVPAELPADLTVVGGAIVEIEVRDLLTLGHAGLQEVHQRRWEGLYHRALMVARPGTDHADIQRAANLGIGMAMLRGVCLEIGAEAVAFQVDKALHEVLIWLLGG